MSIIHEERSSESPYIEKIMRGQTIRDGSAVRPAESHWHMVFGKYCGRGRSLIVGPWSTAGVASWGQGAEIIWIKFKLGTFMPHLPTKDFRDRETLLPDAGRRTFWLKDAAWQFPDYDNVETFVYRLVQAEILVRDEVVHAALQNRQPEISPRTLRHRFLKATGLSQNHIRQFERAQQAAALLQQGVSIIDTAYEMGYFDQPHLTRSLKQFIGYTPAQIAR